MNHPSMTMYLLVAILCGMLCLCSCNGSDPAPGPTAPVDEWKPGIGDRLTGKWEVISKDLNYPDAGTSQISRIHVYKLNAVSPTGEELYDYSSEVFRGEEPPSKDNSLPDFRRMTYSGHESKLAFGVGYADGKLWFGTGTVLSFNCGHKVDKDGKRLIKLTDKSGKNWMIVREAGDDPGGPFTPAADMPAAPPP